MTLYDVLCGLIAALPADSVVTEEQIRAALKALPPDVLKEEWFVPHASDGGGTSDAVTDHLFFMRTTTIQEMLTTGATRFKMIPALTEHARKHLHKTQLLPAHKDLFDSMTRHIATAHL